MMDNDWDLYDFVGSSAGHNAGSGAAKDGFLNHDSFSFPYHDPFDKTFYHRRSPPANPTTPPSAAAGGLGEKLPQFLSLHQRQLQMLKDHNEKNRIGFQALAAKLRRKGQTTLEVRMKVEMLPKDAWSWRKYGQKPIKGSPHPRSYYRCSSSKACAARKQVELSQDNPEEYIVSYFGNHTHGRPASRRSASGTAGDPSPPCEASPTAATGTCLTPTTAPSIAVILDEENEQNDADSIPEEDDDVILIPNNQIAEELFMAMHGFKSAESLSPANNSGGN